MTAAKKKKRVSIPSILNVILIGIAGIVTLYPFIYILVVSISPPASLILHKVWLWPYGFTLESYDAILADSRVPTGFKNSIIYTLCYTIFALFMTMFFAYPLALDVFRRYSRVLMRFIIFTMMFGGGLIPSYLVNRSLGLVNTFWVMVIPGSISAFNLILAKTFVQELPQELIDAATIDGANDVNIFLKIVMPLCKPIMAVLALYYAVGQWNSYLHPLLYLTTPAKHPLQIFLREIVIAANMSQQRQDLQAGAEDAYRFTGETVKCATLVISTVPILCVYPFLQKYFVKGILIGAIKG